MSEPLPEWQPSVYYNEGVVDAPLDRAWELMIDYEAYNPTFVGSTVTHLSGERGAEGEVVLIAKVAHDPGEEAPAPFYCKTAKLVPRSHIVWYLWTDADDQIRNFVDFGLEERPEGVVFSIHYYAQDRLAPEQVESQRAVSNAFFLELIAVFQRHCAANA